MTKQTDYQYITYTILVLIRTLNYFVSEINVIFVTQFSKKYDKTPRQKIDIIDSNLIIAGCII